MLNWQVAIPTYDRAERIAGKTLAMLERGGVPAARITLFVANKKECDKYEALVPRNLYGKVFVGKMGLVEQRNFITDYYTEGMPLVQVDDDLTGVFRATAKNTLVEENNLVELFDEGFATCRAAGAKLWGLYPICNAFYMYGRKPVTTDLKPIIGTVWGNINVRSRRLVCSVKSDIERSVQYYVADGAVVRFNTLSPRQNSRTEPGGHQTAGIRSLASSQAAADYLVATYPGLVVPAPARKGGHAEVRLVQPPV